MPKIMGDEDGESERKRIGQEGVELSNSEVAAMRSDFERLSSGDSDAVGLFSGEAVAHLDGKLLNGKIDVHTHLIPKHWPDFSRRYGYGGFVYLDHDQSIVGTPGCATLVRDGEKIAEIEPTSWDISTRIPDMDAAGVSLQFVSTIPELFCYWVKDDDGSDLARILNNSMYEEILKEPSRFVGLGTVPLQAPELAVEELNRCVLELGFAGVVIGTHVNDWTLDASELTVFWEAADELGCLVLVHGIWSESFQKGSSILPSIAGQSAELCHAMSCFLSGGILEQFSRLRVCFAQGAGTFPYVQAQLESKLQEEERNHVGSLSTVPYRGRLFCDSLVWGKESTEFLVKTMTDQMVVFGSDYPMQARNSGKSYGFDRSTFCDCLDDPGFSRVSRENALLLLQNGT